MIEKDKIQGLIDTVIAEKGIFVVSLSISSNNRITLLVDSQEGIRIEDCVALSRVIENGLDRDTVDFELEVSSPGLDAPLKVKQQYKKNIGKEVEVILTDGKKLKGKLMGFDENKLTVEVRNTIKEKNKKKKQVVVENLDFSYNMVSKVKPVIKF